MIGICSGAFDSDVDEVTVLAHVLGVVVTDGNARVHVALGSRQVQRDGLVGVDVPVRIANLERLVHTSANGNRSKSFRWNATGDLETLLTLVPFPAAGRALA